MVVLPQIVLGIVVFISLYYYNLNLALLTKFEFLFS
jgi:hypothetical protein